MAATLVTFAAPSIACALQASTTPPGAERPSVAQAASASPLTLAPPADFQPGNWAVALAGRVASVDAAVPIVRQVVLVPDAATYVDEIARWSPAGRWPVLFDDDRATLLVRAFQPAQIVRRASVGESLPTSGADLERRLEQIIVTAFGGDPDVDGQDALFARLDYTPPGVVIASTRDPAWTGALAIAAGRALPLTWLDDELPAIDAVLGADQASVLVRRVHAALDATRLRWKSLGDEIDVIAFCRNAPTRALVNLPPAARVTINQPGVEVKPEDPLALTDVLGRADDWSRAAFVGWMPGDESAAAYRAMCALFLPRSRVLLFNGYPVDGAWAAFDTTPAAEQLSAAGYDTMNVVAPEANTAGWLATLTRGWSADIALVNSSGNPDFFDLGNERLGVADVPVLNRPLALHFVHSWSLARPATPATVGGRWLERGVYAYVGSAQEPFLSAFLPPVEFTRRIAAGVPFLPAGRQWMGVLSQPWRICTIGDPCFLAMPPSRDPRRFIDPPTFPTHGPGENVLLLAKDAMRRAAEDRTGPALAEAIQLLERAGQDQVAVQLWQQLSGAGLAPPIAPAALAALGPLHLAGDATAFVNAYELCLPNDALNRDRLWSLVLPTIRPETEANTILLLEGAIRPEQFLLDTRRLHDVILRTKGREEARRFIARMMERANNPVMKDQVRAIGQ